MFLCVLKFPDDKLWSCWAGNFKKDLIKTRRCRCHHHLRSYLSHWWYFHFRICHIGDAFPTDQILCLEYIFWFHHAQQFIFWDRSWMRMDGWYWRNLLQQIWPFSARVASKRRPVRSNEETVFSDAFQVFQVHLKETMSVLCSHLFAKILRAWGLSIDESSAGWLYPGYGISSFIRQNYNDDRDYWWHCNFEKLHSVWFWLW